MNNNYLAHNILVQTLTTHDSDIVLIVQQSEKGVEGGERVLYRSYHTGFHVAILFFCFSLKPL